MSLIIVSYFLNDLVNINLEHAQLRGNFSTIIFYSGKKTCYRLHPYFIFVWHINSRTALTRHYIVIPCILWK